MGPATRRQEIAGREFEVIESDELVFQADRPRLLLAKPHGELALFVGSEARRWQPVIALDPIGSAREASDPPVCTAESPASLYVWHIARPDAAPAQGIDPELRARLQELGYLQEDEPGAASTR